MEATRRAGDRWRRPTMLIGSWGTRVGNGWTRTSTPGATLGHRVCSGSPDGVLGRKAGRFLVLAQRNPRLLFRLSGVLLLRLAPRSLDGSLLFQLPPRHTRLELPQPTRMRNPARVGEFIACEHGVSSQKSSFRFRRIAQRNRCAVFPQGDGRGWQGARGCGLGSTYGKHG